MKQFWEWGATVTALKLLLVPGGQEKSCWLFAWYGRLGFCSFAQSYAQECSVTYHLESIADKVQLLHQYLMPRYRDM